MKLRCIHPASAPEGTRVDVKVQLVAAELTVEFEVVSQGIHSDPSLSKTDSVWGLWERDVVEFFVQPNPEDSRYLEFQVSPEGQGFELEIFEPRKNFNREFRSQFRRQAQVTGPGRWTGFMTIDLSKLGWDGKKENLRGGFFAILGGEDAKSYWSAFLPPQDSPDFHLPQYFCPLF